MIFLTGVKFGTNQSTRFNMKKSTFLISISITCGTCLGQIPNAGFESWGNPDPVGWQTSNNNSGNVINVTQVSPGHSGSSAMKLAAWSYQGFVLASVATCPAVGDAFPFSGHPLSFTGWYKSNLVGGDEVTITTELQQGGNGIGGTSLTLTNTTNVFQQFSGSLIYSGNQNADSAVIAIGLFTSNGGGVGLNASSYIIVDDLSFSNVATGITENKADGENSFLKAAMNGTGELRISYQIKTPGKIKLNLFDITGKQVRTLLDLEQQSGIYRIDEPVTGLMNGVYLVRLESENGVLVRKVVLQQ